MIGINLDKMHLIEQNGTFQVFFRAVDREILCFISGLLPCGRVADVFTIECKAYKKISLYPPFDATLESFFAQANRQAKETQKSPVLIVKANNQPDLFLARTVAAPPTIYSPLVVKDNTGYTWSAFVWKTLDLRTFIEFWEQYGGVIPQ